jgi:hypothetical protein
MDWVTAFSKNADVLTDADFDAEHTGRMNSIPATPTADTDEAEHGAGLISESFIVGGERTGGQQHGQGE